jgi:hypothetical protein
LIFLGASAIIVSIPDLKYFIGKRKKVYYELFSFVQKPQEGNFFRLSVQES